MKKKGGFFLFLFAIISYFFVAIFTTNADNNYYDLKTDIRFCNPSQKHLSLLELIPEKEKNICIQIKNLNQIPKKIQMYFVDGFVDRFSPNYIVCGNREDKKQTFSKFVKFENNNGKKEFLIGPDETLQINAVVKVSKDYIGLMRGCLITEKLNFFVFPIKMISYIVIFVFFTSIILIFLIKEIYIYIKSKRSSKKLNTKKIKSKKKKGK